MELTYAPFLGLGLVPYPLTDLVAQMHPHATCRTKNCSSAQKRHGVHGKCRNLGQTSNFSRLSIEINRESGQTQPKPGFGQQYD